MSSHLPPLLPQTGEARLIELKRLMEYPWNATLGIAPLVLELIADVEQFLSAGSAQAPETPPVDDWCCTQCGQVMAIVRGGGEVECPVCEGRYWVKTQRLQRCRICDGKGVDGETGVGCGPCDACNGTGFIAASSSDEQAEGQR